MGIQWGPSPPQQPLPTFQPKSIVAKRSPISATAELLLKIWRQNPGIFYAESGEIYTEYLNKKWTNDRVMHEKWGSNNIAW